MHVTLYVRTPGEILKAEKMQAKLYARFNTVTVTPYGLDMVQIVAN